MEDPFFLSNEWYSFLDPLLMSFLVNLVAWHSWTTIYCSLNCQIISHICRYSRGIDYYECITFVSMWTGYACAVSTSDLEVNHLKWNDLCTSSLILFSYLLYGKKLKKKITIHSYCSRERDGIGNMPLNDKVPGYCTSNSRNQIFFEATLQMAFFFFFFFFLRGNS